MSQEVRKGPNGVELVAVPGGQAEAMGMVSWWRLSGATGVDTLREALRNAGVADPLLPEAPSPALALGRAVATLENPNTIVRALEGRGNWAVLQAVAGKETMEVKQVLRAYLEGESLNFGEPAASDVAAAAPLIDGITKEFAKQRNLIDVRDLSNWATGFVLRELRSLGLRDTGGIYFIPAAAVGTWQKVTAAIEEVFPHRFYEIPVVKADKAVDGVLAALERDVALAATAMEEELDAQLLGKRGLQGRTQRCENILGKVEEYEALLGRGLDGLRARIGTLKASFTAAALAASQEAA